uniref:Putative secreted protein n=1 Tax=Ixodes ricinus TaxID=34613 RepID=A0A6B0U171_IXORI
MGAAWIFTMSSLACSFGSGISILRSRRPGRSRAGSRVSGRLVAMMIFTWPKESKPSIWFSSSISVL